MQITFPKAKADGTVAGFRRYNFGPGLLLNKRISRAGKIPIDSFDTTNRRGSPYQPPATKQLIFTPSRRKSSLKEIYGGEIDGNLIFFKGLQLAIALVSGHVYDATSRRKN